MKVTNLLLLIALSASSAFAQAITYAWQSATYTSADAPYTTSMRVDASITLAAPLAPNLAGENITTQIQSWRFSDGVNVFTSSNSSFETYASAIPFTVTTDGSGSILSASFFLASPDPDQPNQAGNRFKVIYTSGRSAQLNISNDAECTDNDGIAVGACGFEDGSQEATAVTQNVSATGPWSIFVAPTSTSVPTLPVPAILALIALLGSFGFARFRADPNR